MKNIDRVLLARRLRQAIVPGALLLALAGCASTPAPNTPGPASDARADSQPVVPDIYADGEPETPIEAVRTGRYQLTTLDPSAGQRNLLKQTVTIDLPLFMDLSVADGLKHALRGSGLQLCPSQANSQRFFDPLPVVHRELGPTTLGTALQILAGPAWRMNVDFTDRIVCFDRRAHAARRTARSAASDRLSRPLGIPYE